MIIALSLALLAAKPERVIMAHYMPWYVAKPVNQDWGWHWTMGHFAPPTSLASKYRPLIGPYDSQNPDLVEYHLLTMKMAGIDGVLIDWYGIDKLWDYPGIHKASQLVFEATKKLGMKFGVVYEDQTLKNLISQKVIGESDAISVGQKTMKWLDKNWFGAPNYLKVDGKPALLVFGPQYYKPEDWATLLSGINVSFFTLHHRKGVAVGGFDWPLPNGGNDACDKQRALFLDRAREWPTFISAVYPRFNDIYKEAGVQDSHGIVLDKDGATYRTTLEEALKGNSPVIQIATWNDWGEGTQIEPSKEFGYRDLEVTMKLRREYLPTGPAYTTDDMRLLTRIFMLRGRVSEARQRKILNEAQDLLMNRQRKKAEDKIEELTDY